MFLYFATCLENPMHKYSEYTAVILAGGKNTRFHGYDKAFVRVFGIPMIERVLITLRQVFKQILIVSNSPDSYRTFKDVKVFQDSILNSGPLGGLHSAIKVAKGDAIFLVSCDMPFLKSDLIIEQLEEYSKNSVDVIIPEHDGYYEPMHSVLSSSLLPKIENFLSESGNKTLVKFLISQKHKIWTPSDLHNRQDPFLNINSFEQIEKNGIKGYIAILGFGNDVTENNKLIARESGIILTRAGWGLCVGNAGGTFREAKKACLNDGGIAKLVYSSKDLKGKLNFWPLVEETPDVDHKHMRIAEISMAAIVIGGGEGTLSLVKCMLVSGKPVVYISGTGGITQNKIPGIVVKNSPREAVEYLNKTL